MFKTLLTLSILSTTTALAQDDSYLPGAIDCLVQNVFHEARGEPLSGQRMVMDVVLNRVEDPRWPDNICEVVYQAGQFSWTSDLTVSDQKVYYTENSTYRQIKQRVINWLHNPEISTLANHYATLSTNVAWMDKMELVSQVGNHKFFVSL